MMSSAFNKSKWISIPEKFIQLCAYGDLETVQLFLRSHSQELNMTLFSTFTEAFLEACDQGHLETAQWVYDVRPSIRVALDYDEAFLRSCGNGYLSVAKWLHAVKPDLNVHMWGNNVFYRICANGYTEIGKWWVSIADPERDYYEYITTACGCNNLELIQHIATHYIPDFNVSYSNHLLYYGANYHAIHNHSDNPYNHANHTTKKMEMLEWLHELKPWVYTYTNGIYDIQADKDTVNEKLWYYRKYALWLSSDESPNKKNNILYQLPTDISRMIISSIY